jgi:hypothetical protein
MGGQHDYDYRFDSKSAIVLYNAITTRVVFHQLIYPTIILVFYTMYCIVLYYIILIVVVVNVVDDRHD